MSTTIDRNLPIAITLTAGQWDMVMQAMGHGPYNIVRPLIEEMQRQCWRYATPQASLHERPPMQPPPGGNGEIVPEGL